MHSRIAAHNVCRTVRRISRTECNRAPRSAAIIGEAAVTSPMPNTSKAV